MIKWQGFEKGVNLGGWLSQCIHTDEHYRTFITEEDISVISSWNVDHVRVPVDYDLVETADGAYKEEGFAYIEKCIGWCRKYHLNMILDLHKTYGFSFDEGEKETGLFYSNACQERFFRLWEQFASRFGKNSDMLAFELLNEVTEPEYGMIWNRVSAECIKRIRRTGCICTVLVGGYYNNHAGTVKYLDKPYDEHVVYNFHCYEPLVFTHQGASWIRVMPGDFRCAFDCTEGEMSERTKKILGVPLSGTREENAERAINEDYFIGLFEEAVKKAEDNGTSLYCGEYGVIDLADKAECRKWHSAIHKAFRHYGIGHAVWNYKKLDFGILDRSLSDMLE